MPAVLVEPCAAAVVEVGVLVGDEEWVADTKNESRR